MQDRVPPARRQRSAVPDLLFEDVREARIGEILPLLSCPEQLHDQIPLHRLTVFLTYRCNLDCPYCKTIARSEQELARLPQKQLTFDYAQFSRWIASLETTPVRHLHFTGGEATLVPDLPHMVCLAKERGVAWVSITSNGTLSPRLYHGLVEAGMDEIRISIDAHQPALGQELTQRRRAWSASVETLHALAADRDAGLPFFLVANTVVGLRNRHALAEIVRFLIGLGPDDIKLITEVQEKERLGDFPEATAQLCEIEALLAAYPPEAFPLLRRKLRTVFIPDSVGLADVAAPPHGSWRCFIPLTERTVDGAFYYPCSVYLREGGQPLGSIDEPAALQREKTVAFVAGHDCLADEICRQYCLHCTREYNVAANEARNA